MSTPLPRDWAETFRAQGVSEEDIEAAQALAARLAEVADSHPHDPLGAADPAAFLAILRAEAAR